MLLNIGLAGAQGMPSFLGYEIPRPFRSVLFLLEDDPGEVQNRLREMLKEQEVPERCHIVNRNNFYAAGIPINADTDRFKQEVRAIVRKHRPDLIVFDNLAKIIGAKYGDAPIIERLMTFAYELTQDTGAAVIFAAHPKKLDPEGNIRLDSDPEMFVEQIMGSSHFINSCGSIWALERRDAEGHSIFLGGRQRSEGVAGNTLLYLDDARWFQVLDDATNQLATVIQPKPRRLAWNLLPSTPFRFNEGFTMVKGVLRSKATYNAFIRDLTRVGALVKHDEGLCKSPHVPPEVAVDGLPGAGMGVPMYQ